MVLTLDGLDIPNQILIIEQELETVHKDDEDFQTSGRIVTLDSTVGFNKFSGAIQAVGGITTQGAIYGNRISVDNGTAAIPTIAFSGNPDCGWYRDVSNQAAIFTSINGVTKLKIDDVSLEVYDALDVIAGTARFFNTFQSFATGGMRSTAVQTLSDSTLTTVLFDTEDYDTSSGGTLVDVSNERFVVPYTGIYVISAKLQFASSAVGRRQLFVAVNGSYRLLKSVTTASGSEYLTFSWNKKLTSGDAITFVALQASGGNLDIGTGGGDIVLQTEATIQYLGS